MTTTAPEPCIPGLTLFRRGKVRDVYDLGERLLIVATDRLSAFDHVLPTLIPDKGKILTQVSALWFRLTKDLAHNHFISSDLSAIQKELPKNARLDPEIYAGRVTLARKAARLDVECVARGYLAGSGWKEYAKSGNVCGHALPGGLIEASKLPQPIFTPATKSDTGHDENIAREQLAKIVGKATAEELERLTLALYGFAAAHLAKRGIILADTKLEFGLVKEGIILIDEILTPDSSRLWPAATYKAGSSPASYDKQFVRDFLERSGWDKNPPPPELPGDVVEGTARRYRDYLKAVSS